MAHLHLLRGDSENHQYGVSNVTSPLIKVWQLMRSFEDKLWVFLKTFSRAFTSDKFLEPSKTFTRHRPQIPSPLQELATGTSCSLRVAIKFDPDAHSIGLKDFTKLILGFFWLIGLCFFK